MHSATEYNPHPNPLADYRERGQEGICDCPEGAKGVSGIVLGLWSSCGKLLLAHLAFRQVWEGRDRAARAHLKEMQDDRNHFAHRAEQSGFEPGR